MADAESDVLHTLDHLFLQGGMSGGGSVHYVFFSFSHLPPVDKVLEKFEACVKSRFPDDVVKVKRWFSLIAAPYEPIY